MNRLVELEKLLELEPDDPFLHYAYVIEYVKLNPTAFESKLKELIGKFPDYLPAHEKLARHFYENENEDSALEHATIAVELANKQGATKTAGEMKGLIDEMLFDG